MMAASHSPWYPEVQGWGTGVPGEKTRAAQTCGPFSYGSSQVLALATTFLFFFFSLSFFSSIHTDGEGVLGMESSAFTLGAILDPAEVTLTLAAVRACHTRHGFDLGHCPKRAPGRRHCTKDKSDDTEAKHKSLK